jgi:UDPglucose 6-dehydrogenase
MKALYQPFVRNRDRMIITDIRSAEFIKYAANCMLATRISFMNEMSRLAEKVGADIEMVRVGIGADPRIGTQFLYPGVGYGGSCFPKDVKALAMIAAENGMPSKMLTAVEEVNEEQKMVLVHKIVARYGEDLSGRTFALWGLAFKPNTDDMREAPSRVIIGELLKRGAKVQAYDPVAATEAQRVMDGWAGLSYADGQKQAIEGADALVIVTEWKEFRTPDFDGIAAALKDKVVFDGRNLYEPELIRSFGIEYHSIGRR